MEKGDHIRLDYINLAYDLIRSSRPKALIKNLRLQANADNLNLVLWKAGSYNLDPEYPYQLKPPATFSIGISSTF